MESNSRVFHIVAVPYPGRGHVNPMINLCNSLLASTQNDQNNLIIITVILTQEWLNLIGEYQIPPPTCQTIRFRTIPNVLPSELVRASDFPAFYEAVMTKMEAPIDSLLDRIHPPASLLIADSELPWAISVADRRKIPVASLWPMSASVLSMFRFIDVSQLTEDVHYVDCPGIPRIRVSDLPSVFHKNADQRVSTRALNRVSRLENTQFVLVNTVYELEAQVLETLKEKSQFPIYPIGPAIPYFETKLNVSNPTREIEDNRVEKWLDSQPKCSVLYISLGSYLSVSNEQMEEFSAGVKKSGVRFLWVNRRESQRIEKEVCCDRGSSCLFVPWCDQLRVLCHPCIGGFWTHCGWNSILEAVFAGVPMLTFPITFDQIPNAKQIVDDLKIGWRVRESEDFEKVVTRDEISEKVVKFMNSEDSRELRERARELGTICRKAGGNGGSKENNLDMLIKDMMMSKYNSKN